MQHDFEVANQLFPPTRADINNAFQSAVSNSSGASFPATTFGSMLHYNETDDTLYLRNKANTDWFILGKIIDGEWVPFVAGGAVEQGNTTTLGIWEAATGPEAAALTLDDKAVTPLALASVVATETSPGGLKLATIAEVQAGTVNNEAVTPDGLASLWQQGSTITTASTLAKPADANRGLHHSLSGAGTVSALWAGEVPGKEVVLLAATTGIIFNYNATSLILPGSVDYTTSSGDVLTFKAESGNNWRCISIQKRNGQAVILQTLPEEGHTLQRIIDTYTSRTLLNDIPKDDTVPLSTDGTEIMAVTLNFTADGNKAKIDVSVNIGGAGSDDGLAVVLLRDTTVLNVAGETCMGNSAMHNIAFSYLDSPSTSGNVTYRVRAGGNFANAYTNGNSSGRLYGGAAKCTLVVTEFKP